MKFTIVAPVALFLTLASTPAVAQTVDACQVFTAEHAQAITGKAMKQTRNLAGKTNGLCEFKDASGFNAIGFELWRMPSAANASTYMQATMKQAAAAMRGTPEAIAGLGDEAFYVDRAMSLYVRSGASWFVFGFPGKRPQMIDLAQKLIPKL